MLRSCPMHLNRTRIYGGSSWSRAQFGSETAVRRQATGEVVGEVAKPEGGAALVFASSADGFGWAAGRAG